MCNVSEMTTNGVISTREVSGRNSLVPKTGKNEEARLHCKMERDEISVQKCMQNMSPNSNKNAVGETQQTPHPIAHHTSKHILPISDGRHHLWENPKLWRCGMQCAAYIRHFPAPALTCELLFTSESCSAVNEVHNNSRIYQNTWAHTKRKGRSLTSRTSQLATTTSYSQYQCKVVIPVSRKNFQTWQWEKWRRRHTRHYVGSPISGFHLYGVLFLS